MIPSKKKAQDLDNPGLWVENLWPLETVVIRRVVLRLFSSFPGHQWLSQDPHLI
jgi:hypothetical protein